MRPQKPNLNDWFHMQHYVRNAMNGCVTPKFRAIVLDYKEVWRIVIYLEAPDEEDLELANDIRDDTEIEMRVKNRGVSSYITDGNIELILEEYDPTRPLHTEGEQQLLFKMAVP